VLDAGTLQLDAPQHTPPEHALELQLTSQDAPTQLIRPPQEELPQVTLVVPVALDLTVFPQEIAPLQSTSQLVPLQLIAESQLMDPVHPTWQSCAEQSMAPSQALEPLQSTSHFDPPQAMVPWQELLLLQLMSQVEALLQLMSPRQPETPQLTVQSPVPQVRMEPDRHEEVPQLISQSTA
jgi:hypothetical protein